MRENGQVQQRGEWLNPDEAIKRGLRPPEHRTRTPYPIAMLSDKGSASASEIFMGAMQSHGRATIVGSTSFGKGSVQRELPLANGRRVATGEVEQARMKLTIAKYYLKDGRSIHGVGVKPDAPVDLPEIEGWKFAAYQALLAAKAYPKYEEEWYAKDKALHEKRVEEGAGPDAYPGFEAWAKSVEKEKGGLSRQDLFRFFRWETMKKVVADRGKPFPLSLPIDEDVQLQKAIAVLAGKTGLDLAGIPEYQSFAVCDPKDAPKRGEKAR